MVRLCSQAAMERAGDVLHASWSCARRGASPGSRQRRQRGVGTFKLSVTMWAAWSGCLTLRGEGGLTLRGDHAYREADFVAGLTLRGRGGLTLRGRACHRWLTMRGRACHRTVTRPAPIQ